MSSQQELPSIPTKYNAWFSLGRNVIWVVGLIVIAALKFQNLDNRVENLEAAIDRLQKVQDEQIKTINSNVQNLNNKQNDLGIVLTQVQTLLQERTSNTNAVRQR